MDISGVDVDCLSDEEILELCDDIVDCSDDAILILDKTNVNELTDGKAEELYDKVLYGGNNNANNIKLTDAQIIDLNFNTIDVNEEEILLLNGQNTNIQNLSDDEILALYDDMISSDGNVHIAGAISCKSSSVQTYCIYGYAYNCYLQGERTGYFKLVCETNHEQGSTVMWTNSQSGRTYFDKIQEMLDSCPDLDGRVGQTDSYNGTYYLKTSSLSLYCATYSESVSVKGVTVK